MKKSACGNQQKFTPLYLVSEWNTPTGLYLLGYSTQVTSKSKNMEKVKLICTIVLLNIHECLSNHFSIRDNSFIWWIYPKSNMTYFAKKYGLTVCQYHARDGWHFWHRQNFSVWKPLQGSRGGKVMSISEDTHHYIIGVEFMN